MRNNTEGVSQQTDTQVRWWIRAFIAIIALLSAGYPLLRNSSYMGNAELHVLMEISGAFLGLLAGLAFVTRFYALGNRFHLLIGLAFFINGAEDFAQGFFAITGIHHFSGEPLAVLSHFVPGTYVTGRLVCAILLIMAITAGSKLQHSKKPHFETWLFSLLAIVTTIILTAIAFKINLPQFIYPERFISRPIDAFSALVFFVAMLLFLREYHRSRDFLIWWLLLAIGINTVGQVVMSFSSRFYDPFFDFAHICKTLGYLIPLFGFFSYQIRIITELQKTGEALRENQAVFDAFLEHSPVYIFFKDREIRSLRLSRNYEKMLGMPLENILGKTMDELFPSELAKSMIEDDKRILNEGHVVTRVEELNGRIYETTKFPILFEGTATMLAGFTLDITDRKKAEESLQKAHDELEQTVQERTLELRKTHDQLLHAEKLSAIGQISASIAHEFNNPLQGVMTVIRGVKRRVLLGEEDAKLVDMAVKECDRMKNLIKNLQDFNRPTSGRMAPMNIHAAIDSLLLLSKKAYKTKGLAIKTSYDPNLPQIIAVADQIKQVILNLLSNGADACKGGDTITISTEVVDKESVAIIIQDTGAGIKPEHLGSIFDPFFTTKAEKKGTGLGLSVSYGIIKQHGGRIYVKSEPGQGTAFTITLPVEGVRNA